MLNCDHLADCYAGKLLLLNIIATTIQDLFGGNIAQFLAQNNFIFNDIYRVLNQQF